LLLAIEVFEYKATANNKKIAYFSIGIPIITLFYSFVTLHSHNSYVNYLLPLINFLSFLRLIEDLKFIKSMRFYMKLLEKCLGELKGFFIFLTFITFAFATSSNIIDRNEYRDKIIDLEKGDKTYDIDIY
jgi:hypothetical protein